MINALEIPTEGNVTVNDKTYTAKDKKSQIEVRKQSGMVFQSYNLFPHKTALENVMEGLVTVKKMSKSEARDRALDLLEKVGLTHVKRSTSSCTLWWSTTTCGDCESFSDES